jgi:hypothetical protein
LTLIVLKFFVFTICLQSFVEVYVLWHWMSSSNMGKKKNNVIIVFFIITNSFSEIYIYICFIIRLTA